MLKNVNLKVVTLMILTATPLCSNPMSTFSSILIKGGKFLAGTSAALFLTAGSYALGEKAYFRQTTPTNGIVASTGTHFLSSFALINAYRAGTQVRQNGVSFAGLKDAFPKNRSALVSCLKTSVSLNGLPLWVKATALSSVAIGTVKGSMDVAGYDYRKPLYNLFASNTKSQDQSIKN
jgi:hypothetical protein